MRLFVAIEAGATASAAPEHLTLAFLGEVPEDRVPAIVTALDTAVSGFAPFSFVLEGVGAFPNAQRPRVVWLGVGTGREQVVTLGEAVRSTLRELAPGLDRERFHPHLTLFRVRTPGDRRRAESLLHGDVPPPAPRSVSVHEVVLKSSQLTSHGAFHRTLSAVRLGGSVGP